MNFNFNQENGLNSSILQLSFNSHFNALDQMDIFIQSERNREYDSILVKEQMKFFIEKQSAIDGSLFGKILDPNCHFDENISKSLIWTRQQDKMGLSESESESEQIQIPSTSFDQKPIVYKHKPIRKSKLQIQSSANQTETSTAILAKKFQNETKNLPKNYGKAIIAFALKHFKQFQHLEEFRSVPFDDFKKELVSKRRQMSTISGLKSMWVNFKWGKCMRMLSNLFLRRHSLSYIFNSKISNISPHVKYRYKLLEAIKSPGEFSSIKDF